MKKAFSTAVAGLGVLLLAMAIYVAGVITHSWLMVEATLVMGSAAMVIMFAAMNHFRSGEFLSKNIIVGALLATAGAVWFSINYPYNWDNAAGFGTTEIGVILAAGAFLTMLAPILRDLLTDPKVARRDRLAGAALMGLSLVLGTVALTLYSYAQLKSGINLSLRKPAAIIFPTVTPLFFVGITLLLPRDAYRYSAPSTGFILSALTTLTMSYYYGDGRLHMAADSFTMYFGHTVFGMLTAVGWVLLFGLSFVGLSRYYDVEIPKRIEQVINLTYNQEQERARAPARIFMGIAVDFLAATGSRFLLLWPIGIVIAEALGIPFHIFGESAENVSATPILNWFSEMLEYFFAGIVGTYLIAKFIDKKRWKNYFIDKEVDGDLQPIRSPLYGFALGAIPAMFLSVASVATGWVELTLRPEILNPLILWVPILGIFMTFLYGIGISVLYSVWLPKNIAAGLSKFMDKRAAIMTGIVLAAVYSIADSPVDYSGRLLLINILVYLIFISFVFAGRAYTGRTLLVGGIFAGWTTVTNILFGIPFVFSFKYSLFTADMVGPAIYSGGVYGPTGGILGLIVVITTGLLVYDGAAVLDRDTSLKYSIAYTGNTDEADG